MLRPLLATARCTNLVQKTPISWAELAHFDFFRINFTVWNHTYWATGGDAVSRHVGLWQILPAKMLSCCFLVLFGRWEKFGFPNPFELHTIFTHTLNFWPPILWIKCLTYILFMKSFNYYFSIFEVSFQLGAAKRGNLHWERPIWGCYPTHNPPIGKSDVLIEYCNSSPIIRRQ